MYLIIYIGGLLRTIAGKPIWGLCIYFFSFYFHAPTQWWGQGLPSLRWSLIAALVTMAVLFINPPERGLRFWCYRENRLLSAFVALVFIQWGFVEYPEVHTEYVILSIKFLILIFLIQNILVSKSEIKIFVWVNVLGCAYLAYYGMSMHDHGRMENFGVGSGWDSNLAAQHFAAMMVLGGYLLLEKFNKTHLFIIPCLAVITLGLFLTESRSAIIGLAGTGVLALIFTPQGKKKKLYFFGTVALIAGASLMGPQIIERFSNMSADELGDAKDKSAESRFIIIEAQYEMWKANPLFGYGHRGTLLLSHRYIPVEYHSGVNGRASHNVLMAFLVDHGLIGTLLYFGAIVSCLFRIFGWKFKQDPSTLTEEQKLLSTMMVAGVLALTCFMICGMGANNKKLEADIWLLAFIPLLSQEIKKVKKDLINTNKK